MQILHARYVLQLLYESKKLLKQMPNIVHLSTSYTKEITICGEESQFQFSSLTIRSSIVLSLYTKANLKTFVILMLSTRQVSKHIDK